MGSLCVWVPGSQRRVPYVRSLIQVGQRGYFNRRIFPKFCSFLRKLSTMVYWCYIISPLNGSWIAFSWSHSVSLTTLSSKTSTNVGARPRPPRFRISNEFSFQLVQQISNVEESLTVSIATKPSHQKSLEQWP